MKKSIFKSKTAWVNTIALILAVYELITGDLLSSFGIPLEYHHRIMSIGAFLMAVLNIGLRIKTTQAVTIKKVE